MTRPSVVQFKTQGEHLRQHLCVLCRNVDALPVELDSIYIIRVSFDFVLC